MAKGSISSRKHLDYVIQFNILLLFKTLLYSVQLLGLVSHYCYFSRHTI